MYKKVFFLFIVFTVLLAGVAFHRHYFFDRGGIAKEAPRQDVVAYKGEGGKNALELLIVRGHSFQKDKSGLVVEINNRKANPQKREYWAFYVNKKLSSIGPQEYKTVDSDEIVWKIEKY